MAQKPLTYLTYPQHKDMILHSTILHIAMKMGLEQRKTTIKLLSGF